MHYHRLAYEELAKGVLYQPVYIAVHTHELNGGVVK